MGDRRQSGVWQSNDDGYFERQSGPYQPYQPPTHGDSRRSFSERATRSQPQDAVHRSGSKRQPTVHAPQPIQPMQKLEHLHRDAEDNPNLTSDQLMGGKTRARANTANQPVLRVDPNAVPANLRSKPWSPSPTSPQAQKSERQPSNASRPVRHGSVSDRSPLQKLEYDMSKEEKRARMEQAESRSKRRGQDQSGMPAEGYFARAGTVRSDKARVVSDPARRPVERERRDDKPRNVSAGTQQSPAINGADRFRRASDALRNSPPKQNAPYDANTSRPAAGVPDARAYNGEQRRAARQASDATYRPASVQSSDHPDLERTASGKYKHRARHAGFAGAEAAIAGAGSATAAERGKAAYERRRGQNVDSPQQNSPQQNSPQLNSPQLNSPISPPGRARSGSGSFARTGSKKLQKRPPPPEEWRGKDGPTFRGPQDNANELPRSSSQGRHEPAMRESHSRAREPQGIEAQHGGKPLLQTHRVGAGAKHDQKAANQFQEADPISKERVGTGPNDPVPYSIPPQTAAGQRAKEQVGFATAGAVVGATAGAATSLRPREEDRHHHFKDFLHRTHDDRRAYTSDGRPLEEWRSAIPAKLSLADTDLEDPLVATGVDKNAPWWDKNGRKVSSAGSRPSSSQLDGPYDEEAQSFRPALFLKCGPLLRYTGLRRETPTANGRGGGETWRGSIMIVTEDGASDYSTPPVLRLFAQPMDLHTTPAHRPGQQLHPEDEDPVAGQVKPSRTGRPLYVRHVHDIEPHVDLSREENNHGLFSATRTAMLGPQSMPGADERPSQHISFQNKSRIKRRDGERLNKFREVRAHRLHIERGVTFWRFNLEIALGPRQTRIAYRINRGPAVGFWVPAQGETMNMVFHSCNGFSLSVDPDNFSGPDPLWRDVLNRHQHRPFHVMLGGGDQIYNDAAMRDTRLFQEWLHIKNPEHKHKAEFTTEMQEELETFYLNRYAMWFSQGLFGMANSQIPMVNIWDDHDIIDGFGSYPHHFMSTRVFTGLGAIAFKYYMLFQHQSVVAETTAEEPSWLLGASPGPYISELSRSIFLNLGSKVAFLGLDCRTERMRDEILSQGSYDIIFDRCRAEIKQGFTKHLIVLLGVPIAYPRLNFLENVLTSKVMDPIKAIGRTGALGGFINKFDGGVEILDDLDDHWTAKHHKAERNWFIQELQELAADKSVRITILGGDVHLGAVGQFYSNKKLGVPKDRDHRYMPNVVSSAIVNTPPPPMMADVLNKRNKIHHLDHETDEDMIPMFDHDVDGSKRNNTHLLPRRNFCTLREYHPGSTPPPSPPPSAGAGHGGAYFDERQGRDRRFPPGSMQGGNGGKRTMSLTRSRAGSLVRRLSGRSQNAPPTPLAPEHARPYDANTPAGEPPMLRSSSLGAQQRPSGLGIDDSRPSFNRRPTSLSVKAARKGGAEGAETGHISLEGGLDITLFMECDQTDPSGKTEPYKLLVPALWYTGPSDTNPQDAKEQKSSGGIMARLRGRSASANPNTRRAQSYTPSPSRSRSVSSSRSGHSNGLSASPPPAQRNSHRGELEDLSATATGSRPPAPRGPVRGTSLPGGMPGALRDDQRYDSFGTQADELDEHSPRNGNRGYRRPSAGGRFGSLFRRKTKDDGPQQQQYGYGDGDEDSLTASEEEYAQPAPRTRGVNESGGGFVSPPAQTGGAAGFPERRASKAERFFGMDEGGLDGRQEMEREREQGEWGQRPLNEGEWEGRGWGKDDGAYGEVGRKKKGWMIWK